MFTFHPVHVYLNTDSLAHYVHAKQHHRDSEMLWKLRNLQRVGAHDCFVALLESIRKSDAQTLTMSEVAESARRRVGSPKNGYSHAH